MAGLESGSETTRAILGHSWDAAVIEGILNCLETVQCSEELGLAVNAKASMEFRQHFWKPASAEAQPALIGSLVQHP